MEAVVPIAGSLIGGAMGGNASRDAADTQAAAARESSASQERMLERNLEFQRQLYDQQRADNAGSRDVGNAARDQLARRMGLTVKQSPTMLPPSPSGGGVKPPTAPAPEGPSFGGDTYSWQGPQGTMVWNGTGYSPMTNPQGAAPAPNTAKSMKMAASSPQQGGDAWNREFERLNNIPPQLKGNQDALTSYYKQISSTSPVYKMPGFNPSQGQPQQQPPQQPQQPQPPSGAYSFDDQAQERYGSQTPGQTAPAQSSEGLSGNALIQYRQNLRNNPTAGNPSTGRPVNNTNTNAPAASSPGGNPTQNPGIFADNNGNYQWSDSPGGTNPAGPAAPFQSSAPEGGVQTTVNNRLDDRGMPPQGQGNALSSSVTSPRYQSQYDGSQDYNADSDGGLNAAYGERAPDLITQPYSSQPGALQAPNDVLKPFSMEDFHADPGYQFRLQQGNQGVERSAAAMGGQLSGATMKALARFNQGTADQAYGDAYNRYNQDQSTVYNQKNQNYTNAFNRYNTEQNNIYDQANNNYTNRFNRFNQNQDSQFNRLSALSGSGQVAGAQNNAAAQNLGSNMSQAFTNTGAQVGSNIIGAGNAAAAGQIGAGNAMVGGINSGINAYNQYNMLQQLRGLRKTSDSLGNYFN